MTPIFYFIRTSTSIEEASKHGCDRGYYSPMLILGESERVVRYSILRTSQQLLIFLFSGISCDTDHTAEVRH
jgi:hypothetical protein